MSGCSFDGYAYSIAELFYNVIQEDLKPKRETFIIESWKIVTTWYRPHPMQLHVIPSKPFIKPLPEEEIEDLLLFQCVHHRSELEAYRGSSPRAPNYEKHTHTPTYISKGYPSKQYKCHL